MVESHDPVPTFGTDSLAGQLHRQPTTSTDPAISTVTTGLLSRFTTRGIRSLADVRRAAAHSGGLDALGGDPEAVHLLAAHANLAVLTGDERLRGTLIERGYLSIADVATASRADFVDRLHDTIGDVTAAQLHESAHAQAAFLDSLATGIRADLANGILPRLPGTDEPPGVPNGFPDEPAQCTCKECESAVSPLAYLADLLDYTTKHVTKPGPGLKGEYYDNIDFTNPKLSRADAAVDFNWGSGAPDGSMQPDTFSVRWTGWVLPRYSETYTFHTNTDDGVRLWVDEQKIIEDWKDQSPTERTGTIALTAGRRHAVKMDYYENGGGALAQLFWSSSSQAKEIIPVDRLFCTVGDAIDAQGLADLFHQPFAELPASCSSVEEQVRQVRICVEVLRAHLESPAVWATLTPEQQAAYANAGHDYALAAYESLLTKMGTSITELRLAGDDDTRQKLADRMGIDVAHLDELFLDPNGDPTQSTSLSEASLERLFGLVDTTHDPLQTVAMSDYERWRREYLRAQWQREDWAGELDPGTPIVDPDVVDPQHDFRVPASSTWPQQRWQERRQAVDARLVALKTAREAAGTTAGLTAILEQTFGTPLPDLSGLRVNLAKGIDVENSTKTITETLHLTLESFDRLMAIKDKVDASKQVSDDEWVKVYAILTQAWKVGQFASWRLEEDSPNKPIKRVVLGREQFWIALDEKALTKWLASPDARQRWQQALGVRSSAPIVDPDLISEADIADPIPTNAAYSLLTVRRGWIEQELSDLRDVRQTTARVCAWDKVPGPDESALKSFIADRLGLTWVNGAKVRKSADGKTITLTAGVLPTVNAATITLNDARTGADLSVVSSGGGELGLVQPGRRGGQTYHFAARMQDGALQLYADQAALDALMLRALGVPLAALTALEQQRAKGTDLAPRLDQLAIDAASFNYLLRIRDLAQRGAPILDAEWESVYSILVQAEKRRRFASWRDEERWPFVLTLGPDFFRIPAADPTVFPPPPDVPIPEWRGSAVARRAWQARLQARIDAGQAAVNALHAAVSETEEATLPGLRDALVLLAMPDRVSLEAGADALAQQLFIETKDDGCRMTTRVAQAIETLQLLLWGARTGQLEGARPDLAPAFDDWFDEEWRWIGSYQAWRSAMFVLLYPENVLAPTLREHQTPAFRRLVDNLRSRTRLTPDGARDLAAAYSAYFRDVCSLEPQASVTAKTRVARDGAGGGGPDERDLQHLFARSVSSHTVYWSTLDPAQPDQSYAQTYWDAVPGFENVISVIGGVSYDATPPGTPGAPPRRGLYAFARVQSADVQRLIFNRYDLEGGYWNDEPTELELPEKATEFEARLKNTTESVPPHLGIRLSSGDLYVRSLGQKGVDWERGGFQRMLTGFDPSTQTVGGKFAIVGDFDGDGTAEVAIAPDIRPGDPVQSRGNDFWVMDLDANTGRWQHLTDLANSWADLDCSSSPYRANFGVAGDFDGDGRDEIAVAPLVLPGDPTQSLGNDFWVMDLDPGTRHWQPLSKIAGNPIDASLDCGVNDPDHAKFAVAGDFDGDGYDELAVPRDRTDSAGNDFWVVKYRPTTQDWTPLASLDASGGPDPANFAVVGTFTRKDRDQIAIAPAGGATGLWTWQYDNRGGWTPLDSVPTLLAATHAVAGDFDGDGYDELAITPADGAPPAGKSYLWVMAHGSRPTWQHLSPQAGHARDADVVYGTNGNPVRFILVGDVDHDQCDEIIVVSDPQRFLEVCEYYVLDYAPDPLPQDPKHRAWRQLVPTVSPDVSHFDRLTVFAAAGDFDGDKQAEVLFGIDRNVEENLELPNRRGRLWAMDFDTSAADWQSFVPVPDIAPVFAGPFDVTDQYSVARLQQHASVVQAAMTANVAGRQSSLTYFEEAWYFVPFQLALQLQETGQFTAALDWYRTIYDYGESGEDRKIYYGLQLEEQLPGGFGRPADWLRDPIDPHGIASTRCNTYTRYTLMAIVRCLLEYADAEFTRDTAESLPRARMLFLTALGLLDLPELKQQLDACNVILSALDIAVRRTMLPSDDPLPAGWSLLRRDLARVLDPSTLRSVLTPIRGVLAGAGGWEERLVSAREIVQRILVAAPADVSLAAVLRERHELARGTHAALLALDGLVEAARRVGEAAARDLVRAAAVAMHATPEELSNDGAELPWLRVRLSGLGMGAGAAGGAAMAVATFHTARSFRGGYALTPRSFCVPANSVLRALRLHAELNLFKLRTCRNIAGLRRDVDPYAAPADATSGMPAIGSGGQLTVPGTVVVRPTQYRYATLIERAKQLTSLAQQIEAAYLSALEKRDGEYYNLLKARQDMRLAHAGVRLQTLRVTEAEDGVQLARLQQHRAQIQVTHYQGLLAQELSGLETDAILMMAAGIVLAGPSALQVGAQLLTTVASYERRREEWQFQQSLAQEDVRIGGQQVRIADDHVQIAGQERSIAEMQADHAQAVVDFLANKFTNVELYDWMTSVLRRVYGLFLQHATGMAQLAANQLAFERQEIPPPFIQADYWELPAGSTSGAATNGRGPDRQGLTGSARLLADIYQLDQYAFEKNKRKLQLTETISLARLMPAEFQRFRETGVLRFATPSELFDHRLPGNYLRLIRRVRTSVVALVPPSVGIRATLSTTGTGRVVIGGDTFQEVVVRRGPESVTLTSPRDATGVFDLDPQAEMLLPFEALPVDAPWELSLPKAANPFDFRTIADVLLTVEYTALHSDAYRAQVLRTLSPKVSADRAFSFRYELADQWYDLHNPDQVAPPAVPMTVRFETTRADFPPNADHLAIQHVVLHFARADGETRDVPLLALRFTPTGGSTPLGGEATPVDGRVSTRSNGASWFPLIGKSPIGTWELALPYDPANINDRTTAMIRDLFTGGPDKRGTIEDVLLVITYSGETPPWPK